MKAIISRDVTPVSHKGGRASFYYSEESRVRLAL